MFRENLTKKIKIGIKHGYSNFESWRMLAGAAELTYTNPSRKRLKEMMDYSTSIMYSKNTTHQAKKKANLLYNECVEIDSLKRLMERYSKLSREGKL